MCCNSHEIFTQEHRVDSASLMILGPLRHSQIMGI